MSGPSEPTKLPAAEPAAEGAEAKKTYRKPDFQYETVFETMALACGKVSPTQLQCHFNRKNS